MSESLRAVTRVVTTLVRFHTFLHTHARALLVTKTHKTVCFVPLNVAKTSPDSVAAAVLAYLDIG